MPLSTTTPEAASPLAGRHPRRGRRRVAALAATALAAVLGVAPLTVGGTASAAPAPAAPAATAACSLSAKLVPSCGVLWGAAPAAFDYSSRIASTSRFESLIGRGLDYYHGYKSNGQLFPSAEEIAISNGSGGAPRLLHFNWRPGMDMTWAAFASGRGAARIDNLSNYLKKNYKKKFFLSIWHEPEHFVKPTAGSGMTANDYRTMVRYTINRLKANGVNNAVFVQIFQGYPAYATTSWWKDMYPGDDVIDWIATDSYNSGKSSGYNSGGFAEMVNRTKGSWKGFYNWATKEHPGKPLMVAEWGVFANSSEAGRQGWFYDDVRTKLANYPAIKAMGYFNAHKLDKGTTRIDANSTSLSAYKKLTGSLQRVDLSSAG